MSCDSDTYEKIEGQKTNIETIKAASSIYIYQNNLQVIPISEKI